MNRRRITIPAALLLTAIAAGCTTFDSSDTAARVGDDTLDTDTLTELVEMLPSPTTGAPGDPNNASDVRNGITLWVQATAIDQYVDDEGIEVTDDDVAAAQQLLDSALPGWTDGPEGAQQVLVDYFAASNALDGLPEADDAEIIEFYDRGPEASGITCAAHILVETEDEAAEILAELEAGADFATLANERTTDPSGQSTGGALPCTSTAGFAQSYVPEFVEATMALGVGDISDPVHTDFGVHIITLRPYDDAIAEELASYFASPDFRIAQALFAADVSVKPRFGTFTDEFVVAPLG